MQHLKNLLQVISTGENCQWPVYFKGQEKTVHFLFQGMFKIISSWTATRDVLLSPIHLTTNATRMSITSEYEPQRWASSLPSPPKLTFKFSSKTLMIMPQNSLNNGTDTLYLKVHQWAQLCYRFQLRTVILV